MGSVLSSPAKSAPQANPSPRCSNKRLKMSSLCENADSRLIPSLPDEISLQIIARVPRIHYLALKSVSRGWKSAVACRGMYKLRKEMGTTEEWLYLLTKDSGSRLQWCALDPLSGRWQRLPLMPITGCRCDKGGTRSEALGLRIWEAVVPSVLIKGLIQGFFRRRRDGLHQLPFCGCSVGAVDGCLFVLGGFAEAAALDSVVRYDPWANAWDEVRPMGLARAFCKAGSLNEKLYVVGGVSRGRNGLQPLQSAEVFDPETGFWTDLPAMPFGKANMLPTAFLTDVLKPIATGMVAHRGKLCVPQSLYSWPFFFDIGGEVYDPEANSWTVMPSGMSDGWPAKQAGTKLGVDINGELYALEPSENLDSGQIVRYDHEEDVWKLIVDEVPIPDFIDPESPFLLACLLGTLHVITKDVHNSITVLQAAPHPSSTILAQPSIPLKRSFASSSSAASTPAEHNAPEELGVWKLLAAMDFGGVELVSCQVLNV